MDWSNYPLKWHWETGMCHDDSGIQMGMENSQKTGGIQLS